MKSKRLIVYLGGAVLVVVSFWGTMATVQKSRRGNTGAPATPSEAAGQKSQGQDIPQSTGVAPKVSSADNRNWWGVNVRARTLQVDPDEPPVQAAEVTEIRPGSPAATAGLHVGDAIVGLNRQPLAGSGQLESGVGSVAFGGKLTVDLIRAGEPVELTLTRGEATSGGGLAQAGQAGSPVPAAGGANPQSRSGIFINGQEISQQQVGELRALYGYVAPPGKYWYDSRGGLFGATLLLILFRRRYPRWWFDFAREFTRFGARVGAYLALLSDQYPSTVDEQAVHLEIDYPDVEADLNRWLPLVKWLK